MRRLLAAADEAGSVSVSDLRMLGTQRKAQQTNSHPKMQKMEGNMKGH